MWVKNAHAVPEIYGHPVIAATRALRFADHVTKGNGGSGDENEVVVVKSY